MGLSAGASQAHGFNTDPPRRFNVISSPLAHRALCEGQVYYGGLGQDKIPTSVCFSLIIFSLCRAALSQIRTIVLSSTTPLSVRKELVTEGKCASKRPSGGDEMCDSIRDILRILARVRYQTRLASQLVTVISLANLLGLSRQ
jgi:hypothetical protein